MMRRRSSNKKNFANGFQLSLWESIPPMKAKILPNPPLTRLIKSRWSVVRQIERLVPKRFETIVWFHFDIYLNYDRYGDLDLFCDISEYVPLLTYPF